MNAIYFFSGPCGVGKTTISEGFARQLVEQGATVCLIHGDDFHENVLLPDEQACFTEDGQIRDPETWNRIIGFNWRCLLDMAGNALDADMDVVIDYVIEEELPLVEALAKQKHAALHYILLTASQEALTQRIERRGDTETIARSLFLKEQLEGNAENRKHLLDTSALSPAEILFRVQSGNYLICL